MKPQATPQNNYLYNRKLLPLARKLRKNMTKAEVCIWKYLLRAGKMHGCTFNRQRPVLNYIADFMCKELLLIIEIDGSIHNREDVRKKDAVREQDLIDVGFTFLRFSNWEVLHRMEDVSEVITKWMDEHKN